MRFITVQRLLLSYLAMVPAVAAAEGPVKSIVDRCMSPTTTPRLVSRGFTTMDHSPVMGNGCLMVTMAGMPEKLTLYLGKTDFWMDRMGKVQWQSANVLAGHVNLVLPSMMGAKFEQVQDMYRAEVRTTLSKGNQVLHIRAITPHESDNLVICEIANQGNAAVAMQVESCTDQHVNKALAFEIASGKEDAPEPIGWVTRKTPRPEPHDQFGDREFRMWAAIATRVMGAAGKVETSAGESQAKATTSFMLEAGRTVRVVTQVHSTGIPISIDPADPKPKAIAAISRLTAADLEAHMARHQAWWADFWGKSHIQLDSEPLVERVYYGALYVLGCGNKVGQYPAGCNGWPVDDNVPWGGDYHWNYNNQAPYYGVFSSNRVELSEPYDRTVNEANEFGKRQAKALKAPGTFFFIATAPGHLNEPIIVGQKTHAVEAALIQINHWYYTYDLDWMKKNHAFLKDVAAYWDWDLMRSKETFPNGCYRYVIKDSAPMEGASHDHFNGITGLAFLRRVYQGMVDITRELESAGVSTGTTKADLDRWQDFLLHLSDYPMSFAYGRKVLAWSEESLNPLLTEQDWVLYPVFPAEQVTLSSDPRLLKVCRNTLVIKPQYYVEWLNNPTQIFSMAARLGHHPPEVLERFKTYYGSIGVSNFKSGGGNTEGSAIAESVNSMLLQSHEGFLRLFPCWHRDARFDRLRAVGAFLVSGEKKMGACQSLTVFSEKGRACGILNPWRGRTLVVKTADGQEVGVTAENRPYGQVCTFKTEVGKTYTVSPKEGLPAKVAWGNAALYASATASSSHKPRGEEKNWDVAKLTDGTRINTRVGHRGWSSALRDSAEHAEWVQIDLGEAATAKRIDLWPLDHGDAWQHTHCMEPFVNSKEIDQSYDGFPIDFRILVSTDGAKWDEIARRERYLLPHVAPEQTDQKVRDTTGPESFQLKPRSVRYVKVEATKLRKTRYFGKHAMQLAEVEVIRADAE